MTPKEQIAMQPSQQAIAAMRLALEALEESCYPRLSAKHTDRYEEAITALEEALSEQSEQKPVAWFVQYKNRHEFVFGNKPEFIMDGVVEPLYAAPLAKQVTPVTQAVRTKDPCNPLQDLTDDEILKIVYKDYGNPMSSVDIARAVIAADREKNK